jgi:antitoxin HicB
MITNDRKGSRRAVGKCGVVERHTEKSRFEDMSEYPVVFELEADGRYSVFAPDLPGCASWGETREQAREHIREAIELWIESARADGDPIPCPNSSIEVIPVAA